jgi:hypothetical protein
MLQIVFNAGIGGRDQNADTGALGKLDIVHGDISLGVRWLWLI